MQEGVLEPPGPDCAFELLAHEIPMWSGEGPGYWAGRRPRAAQQHWPTGAGAFQTGQLS